MSPATLQTLVYLGITIVLAVLVVGLSFYWAFRE